MKEWKPILSFEEITLEYILKRSPEYYIKQAQKRSAVLAQLIRRNFEKEEVPERIYRRCDGLLFLQRKTDPVVFERVCLYAINYDLLSCKSLQKIIENKAYELVEIKQKENVIEREKRPSYENIRGKEYYNHQIKTVSEWNKSNQN